MILRRLAVTLSLAIGLIASGCSSSDDGGTLPPLDTTDTADTEAEPAEDTAPTTESTTTTPPTTLSERELAEAEISQVLIGWWQSPYDTSQDMTAKLAPLTGLQLRQSSDYFDSLEGRGLIERDSGSAPIEVLGVSVDLEAGTAEVDVCNQLTHEFVDIDTGDIVEDLDPDFPFPSQFIVELVEDEWKISAWIPASNEAATDDDEMCEIGV